MNNEKKFIKLTPFKMQVLQSFPFIDEDFDAITNYELLCKVVEYLNKTVENVDLLNEKVEEFQNYFDNLDVQEEINIKLDAMAEDGTLTYLIKTYIDPIYEEYENNINSDISSFKNSVNSELSSINDKVDAVSSGSPAGVYATKTALSTADPDHNKIYVVNADGYWYYYDTTSSDWEQGGVYQSSVDLDSVSDLEEMINPISLTDLNLAQGSIALDGTVNKSATNRIYTQNVIHGYHKITVPSGYLISIVCYYNPTTDAFVSSSAINQQSASLGNSTNVYRLSIKKSDDTSISVNELDRSRIISDIMNQNSQTIIDNMPLYQGGVNLDGTFNSLSNRVRTDYIYKDTVLFAPSGYVINGIYYFNSDLTFSNFVDCSVRPVCYVKDKIGIVVFKKSDNGNLTPNDLRSYYKDTSNPLSNKKILTFGDSIVSGEANDGKSYGYYIANKNQMTLSNQGVSGSTLAVVPSNPYGSIYTKIHTFIDSDSNNYDFILLEGGCNDINYYVSLGNIIDGYDTSLCDTSTISGALEKSISELRNKYAQANIIFVTNHKMSSRNWELQNSYHNRIIEICKKWSIPVADMFNEGQLSSYIESMATTCFPVNVTSPTGYDRTHPNALGYKNYYCPLIESVMKKVDHFE